MSRAAPVTAYADANVCIALLAGSPHSAHDLAVEMFRRVAEGRLVLILTPVIVAEIVYAARTRFRWGNHEIAQRLAAFLAADGLIVREGSNVIAALGLIGERRIDLQMPTLRPSRSIQDPRWWHRSTATSTASTV